jgi:hypothetical protein
MTKLFVGAATFALFLTIGFANALTIDTSTIDTNVNLNPGSLDVNTNIDGTTTDVNLQNTGTGLNINTSGSSIPGTSIQLKSGQGLDVLVSGGNVSVSDQQVLVNLEGGSEVLIKNDTDLAAYNTLVVQTRPSVVSVSSGDGGLQVEYKQPGKFLGIFKSHLNGKVVVLENGTVEVRMPWYAVFYKKNTGTVKSNITASLQSSNNKLDVSVVSSGDGKSVTVQNKAKVINVVTSAIDTTVSISK